MRPGGFDKRDLTTVGSLTAKNPEREQRMRPTRPNQTLRFGQVGVEAEGEGEGEAEREGEGEAEGESEGGVDYQEEAMMVMVIGIRYWCVWVGVVGCGRAGFDQQLAGPIGL